MVKKYAFWHLICIVIGVLLLFLSIFLCRTYLLAEIRFKTEATLIDAKISKGYKKDSNGDSEKYYNYNLTWEYKDIDRDKTIQYTTHVKKSYDNLYKVGQKSTVYVYSNDGENYYEFDWMACIITGGMGIFFIVVAGIDFIYVTKRKKEQENWQNVIKERVKQKQEEKNK